jgi:microcystin-dependent protein
VSEPYLGEIRIFAGTYAIRGWAFCDGRLLSIAENEALFSLLGTTYGGDGVTTFALPDLRGRVPIHAGQAQGLSPYVLGQTGGSESVTLRAEQLPAHTHTFGAATRAADTATPGGNLLGNTGDVLLYHTPAGTPSMDPKTIQPTGGNQPHDNMAPFLAMNFIIALEGIYPTRG